MIDVCVTTYNGKEQLKKFLDTLYSDYEPGVFTLYISDNGSKDGTAEYVASIEAPSLGAKFMNHNIGYAGACNKMAAAGTSEFIALHNDDTWMTTSDVKAMESSFAETDADILGPKQRDENGKVRHGGIFGSNTRPRFRGWGQDDVNDSLFRDRVDAVTVSGSAYYIRRSTWNALTNDVEYRKLVPDAEGAFLPTHLYYEETFCSYLANHRGYKVMYDGSVSIGHTWHKTIGRPENSYVDSKTVRESRTQFRTACDFLGIPHD